MQERPGAAVVLGITPVVLEPRLIPHKYALKALALLLVSTTCAMAAPTITSFTPTTGTIGTVVTITGTGFTGATAVAFHGLAAASYTVVSATKITATAPNSVSTGPIKVTVGSTSVTSSTNFTVTPGMGLSITAGHPLITTTVSAAGFHASAAVDAYFDNANLALFVTSTKGTISTTLQIPVSAQPCQHWITFVERGSYSAAQKAFTVRTDWPNQGFGPSGRGVNPYENTLNTANVNNLTAAWSGNAGEFSNESPFVVAGGSVFVTDVNNELFAYSKTGTLLWSAAPGADLGTYGYQGNLSPIAVNNGSALFTTADGMLHRPGGTVTWDVATSTCGCYVAPVIAYGNVYAGGCSNLGAYPAPADKRLEQARDEICRANCSACV